MKSASRSTPTPVMPGTDEHRELGARRAPRAASVRSSSAIVGISPVRYLSSCSSSPDTISSTSSSCRRCSSSAMSSGSGSLWCRPSGSYSSASSVSTSATPWNASSSPSGSSSGANPWPKTLAQLVEHGVEVGAVLVLPGDEDHPRQAERRRTCATRVSVPTSIPSTALITMTARSATDERGVDVGDEVGIAGGVDQVDLVGVAVGRLPLERRDRRARSTSGGRSPPARCR